jgi:WD40 repeat protein
VAFKGNIATGGSNGEVKMWDLNGIKEKSLSKALRSPPSCISFSENGMMMAVSATGPKDNFNIKILPTGNRSMLMGKTNFEGHLDSVFSCCFTRLSNKVVSASADKTVRLWDMNTGKDKKFPMITSNPHSVDINIGDSYCAVGFNSGTIKMYGLHDMKLAHTI